MQSKILTLVFTIIAASSTIAKGWTGELCPSILLEGAEEVSFSKNETLLICGSKKVKEWNELSLTQSIFHLKTFLEAKGYFKVETERTAEKIVVHFGQKTYVKSWELQDGGLLEASRFRLIKGEVRSPSLMDSLTERIKLTLENTGYACSDVNTKASVEDKKLSVEVKPVEKKTIRSVHREPVEGMDSKFLKRYDAFTIGGISNRDNLKLTENRIAAEGILQNVHFDTSCTKHSVDLTEKNVAGPPRMLTFGVGINTEKGPSAKATWKHVRLGKHASNFVVSLTGTFRDQRLDVVSDLYFPSPLSRFHLNPSFSLSHTIDNGERYNGQLSLTPATSWDNDEIGLQALFGPTLNFERRISGIGPRESQFAAFKTFVLYREHVYEVHENSPVQGLEMDLNSLHAVQSILSSFSATKLDFHATKLWNLFQWDPPAVILGVRLNASTTLTGEEVTGSTRLPANFRHFLGGSRDIRGFSRLSLPGPEGALTVLSGSTELRLATILPWNLQPLVFIDAAMLSIRPLQLDNTMYWSPGLGMRLESLIGVFRVTFARGLVYKDSVNEGKQWNLYFSFGEEF